MFQFYGRSETSFVCAVGIVPRLFAATKQRGWTAHQQEEFPRYINEEEFVLLVEVNENGEPTGNELTLFADIVGGGRISFQVVDGDPDEYWARWKGVFHE